jgi:O-antigen ligase
MAKKHGRAVTGPQRDAKTPASAGARDPGAAIAAAVLAAVLLCAGLLVDVRADSSFDSPKRLFMLAGVVLAAIAAFGLSRWRNPLGDQKVFDRGTRLRRAVFLLLCAALAGALLSAIASPRRALSLDALRVVLLTCLLLPIGASRVLERKKPLLVATFLGVTAVNASVSILQARGLYQPFELVTQGSRESTGAFVGNVGYLALTLALGSVAALGLFLTHRRPLVRVLAAAATLLFLGALLANRNLTSLSALTFGSALLLFGLYGRRALAPVFGFLLLLTAAICAYRPTRERAAQAVTDLRTRQWDVLTSYRLGPWAAAVAMASERPLVGFGPGTFEAEFVPHRLKAEIRLRQRLTNPLPTSSYAEAHCDYLQPFAETGLPAGLTALACAAVLLAGLARTARDTAAAHRTEAVLLLAFLGSGAAAALTWFPLQRPITAVPLLLAAGRAWRISRRASDPDTVAAKTTALESANGKAQRLQRPARLARNLGMTLLLAWAFFPEIPRYRAERSIRLGVRALNFLLTHPAEVADAPKTLERISRLALAALNDLPYDTRPWLLLGSARLVGGQPDLALERYRDALATGERAVTDLNIAHAYEGLGRMDEANAAYLRGVWVSPALLPLLLPDVAGPLRTEVARLETELKAGRLKAPPPLP